MSVRPGILTQVVVLACAIGFSFGASLEAGYIAFDDPQMVAENRLLDDPGWDDVRTVFLETRNDAWLPLYTLAYFPEALLLGKDPFSFHLASLVWHLLVSVLVLLLLRKLLGEGWLPLGGALVFALHPLIAESVVWISGRKEEVSLFFLLLGLLCWDAWLRGGAKKSPRRERASEPRSAHSENHYEGQTSHAVSSYESRGSSAHSPSKASLQHPLRGGGRSRFLAASAFFLAGCFAKASVVVFPILAALWMLRPAASEAVVVERKIRRRGLVFLFALAMLPVAVHLRAAMASGAGGAAALHGPGEGVLLFLEALSGYAWHLLFPLNLSIHYDLDPGAPLFTLSHLAGAALLVMLIAAAFRFRQGPAGWGAAWILVALLPFNNVFPRTSVPMADRYLAVAMPAVALLVALGLRRIPARTPRRIAWLVLLVLLSMAARKRTAEFHDTLTVFEAARRHDPADPLPPLKIGEELLRRGRSKAAIAAFGEAVGLAHDPVREIRARLLLGDALLRDGAFAPAEREFRRVLELHEEDPERFESLDLDPELVAYQRSQCLLGLGREAEARALLEEILRRRPDHPWAHLALARLDLRRGFEQRAGEDANPDGARERVDRGIMALERLLEDERILGSLRGDERRTFLKETRKALVLAHLAATWRPGWRTAAISQAEFLVSLDPEDPEGYVVRAGVWKKAGRDDLVLEDLRLALDLDPASARLRLLVARQYRAMRRNRLARRTLLSILEDDPEDQAARLELADLFRALARHHLNKQDLPRAREAAREALKWMPDLPAAAVVLADVLAAAGEWEEAAENYRRALDLDPGDREARLGLARYYQALGLGTQARLRKQVAAAPEDQRQEVRRRLEEAIRGAFRKALELGGDSPDVSMARRFLAAEKRAEEQRVVRALRRKAEKEWRAGDEDAALATLEEATRIDGTDLGVWLRLAEWRMRKGRLDDALTAAERALTLDSENLQALAMAARIHHIKGRPARARKAVERFLRAAEDYPEDPILERMKEEMRALHLLVGGRPGRRG